MIEIELKIEKLFMERCHSETIKELIFIDSFNILSSSSDKKICHTVIQKNNLKSGKKKYFFLKIQCKNMVIDGIKEEAEFEKLSELIEFEKGSVN